jgi:small subunit ribosomal protein S19
MIQEFLYRGKTVEELKLMDLREFAKYLKSKDRRYILRQNQNIQKFLAVCDKKEKKGKKIRTHIREMIVVPRLIGLIINVHNGKEFVPIKIIPEMLGRKLGEFSITRKKVAHSAPGIGATRSSAALSVK